MTRYVIDSSVAVEYLLKTPLGLTVTGTIESAYLVAPELMYVEVLSVLRRAVLAERLKEERALLAIHCLVRWPVDRLSNRDLALSAWQYRRTVSAYDAIYLAAARTCDIPLLTADARLSRAPGLGVAVHNVRIT